MGDLKNKVILIGGNHHNGLGLARSFGVNGTNRMALLSARAQSMVLSENRNIGLKHGRLNRTTKLSSSF